MKILYVTPWVLGDAGANAADIFPRLSVADPAIEQVYVADFPKNKHHIKARQGAQYLKLEWGQSWLRYAARIARKAKQENIDIIHIFYRQQNAVLLILVRIFLAVFMARSRIVMDHRSVNLAKGWRRQRKLMINFAMQLFTHHLAGNPWAVETNHFWVFRPKHIIDLGYDNLPECEPRRAVSYLGPVDVWFIGSLKPKNRKTQFLLDVFDRVSELQNNAQVRPLRPVRFRVAGPANPQQTKRLKSNRDVIYYGALKRNHLYALLQRFPGIGLAFMNTEYHEYAPSLKFAEYAIMRFQILSSDTRGLRTQSQRMNMRGVDFLPENVEVWAQAIVARANAYSGLAPEWADARAWAYPAIFKRQVLKLYTNLAPGLASS